MSEITLPGGFYDADCQLDPADQHRHVRTVPRPQGRVTAVNARPYAENPWETSPPGDGRANLVSGALTWEGFALDVQRDLANELLTAARGLTQAVATVTTGNLDQGLRDLLAHVRRLLEDSYREIEVVWAFDIDVQGAGEHFVYVHHEEEGRAEVTHVLAGAAAGMPPLRWTIDCQCVVDHVARPLLGADATNYQSADRLLLLGDDAFRLREGVRTFQVSSRLRIDSLGYRRELENLVARIQAQLRTWMQFQAGLRDLIAQLARELFDEAYDALTGAQRGAVQREVDVQRSLLAEGVVADVGRLIDETIATITLLLEAWTGKVELGASRFRVHCLTAEGYDLILTLLDLLRHRENRRELTEAEYRELLERLPLERPLALPEAQPLPPKPRPEKPSPLEPGEKSPKKPEPV